MKKQSRRDFIRTTIGTTAALAMFRNMPDPFWLKASGMKLGLVTYMWGADWDLPTLISNCEKTGLLGLELRVDHAHKVEINLTSAQRAEVRKRFADSSVKCVGYGSNFEYHSPDLIQLREEYRRNKRIYKTLQRYRSIRYKGKTKQSSSGSSKGKNNCTDCCIA